MNQIKAGYYLTKLMIAISTFKGDKRRMKKLKKGLAKMRASCAKSRGVIIQKPSSAGISDHPY